MFKINLTQRPNLNLYQTQKYSCFRKDGHYATISNARLSVTALVLMEYILYFLSEKVQGRCRKDHAILCACSRHTRNAESPWESKELQHSTYI